MDWEMLLAVGRRGTSEFAPVENVYGSRSSERTTAWQHMLYEQVRGLTETDQFSNLRHLFSKGVPCVRDAVGLQPECVSPVLRMSCSDRKRS